MTRQRVKGQSGGRQTRLSLRGKLDLLYARTPPCVSAWRDSSPTNRFVLWCMCPSLTENAAGNDGTGLEDKATDKRKEESLGRCATEDA